MSAPRLCSKCKTRPRRTYGSGRTYSYCHECAREQQKAYQARRYSSYGSLHRMADQYRPQKAKTDEKP